ncbi:DeoR family transcriptional regulator [Escherichia coli]
MSPRRRSARDIRKLSEQGLITRHHGGAGRASSVVNTAFEQREVSANRGKKSDCRSGGRLYS